MRCFFLIFSEKVFIPPVAELLRFRSPERVSSPKVKKATLSPNDGFGLQKSGSCITSGFHPGFWILEFPTTSLLMGSGSKSRVWVPKKWGFPLWVSTMSLDVIGTL